MSTAIQSTTQCCRKRRIPRLSRKRRRLFCKEKCQRSRRAYIIRLDPMALYYYSWRPSLAHRRGARFSCKEQPPQQMRGTGQILLIWPKSFHQSLTLSTIRGGNVRKLLKNTFIEPPCTAIRSRNFKVLQNQLPFMSDHLSVPPEDNASSCSTTVGGLEIEMARERADAAGMRLWRIKVFPEQSITLRALRQLSLWRILSYRYVAPSFRRLLGATGKPAVAPARCGLSDQVLLLGQVGMAVGRSLRRSGQCINQNINTLVISLTRSCSAGGLLQPELGTPGNGIHQQNLKSLGLHKHCLRLHARGITRLGPGTSVMLV